MSEKDFVLHYVSTMDEAKKLVEGRDQFWVLNCGCREENGPCKQSRIDVCLEFSGGETSWGSNKHPVSKDEVEGIFREAAEKHLVPRPFRDEKNPAISDGICFCCECCCEYFIKRDKYRCDKGAYIEVTDKELCSACGTCEEVCYFGARTLDDDELTINQEECCGCGLCADVCPDECVEMVVRDIENYLQ